MQVFKLFWKVVKKRKTSLLVYLGIFLTLAIVMSSFGGTETQKQFQAEKYEVALFDYDGSKASKAFCDYIKDQTDIRTFEDDAEMLRDELFARNLHCVLYIREGFEEELLDGNVEELIDVTTLPGTVYSRSVLGIVEQYMTTLRAYLEVDVPLEKAMEKTADLLSAETKVTFSGENNTSGRKSQLYYYMLYLPYVLISSMILVLGSSLLVLRKKDVSDRMHISAYPLRRLNVEMWGGSVLMALGYGLVFLALAAVIYGKKLFGMGGLFMTLNLFCFVFVSLGLTFMLSMLIKKGETLGMASTVLGLAMAFMGGIFVPLSVMGEGMKMVAHFIPAYWYVQVLEQIEQGGVSKYMARIGLGMGIQLLFAVMFTALGLAFSRKKSR